MGVIRILNIQVAVKGDVLDEDVYDEMGALLTERGMGGDGCIVDWRYSGAELLIDTHGQLDEGDVFDLVDCRSQTTAVPNPPYPYRTLICANCGAAVHEEDIADGNLCHICFKSGTR